MFIIGHYPTTMWSPMIHLILCTCYCKKYFSYYYYLLLLFSMTTLLPIEDMFGAIWTHFESCLGGFGHVHNNGWAQCRLQQAQNVHNTRFKVCLGIIIHLFFFSKKMNQAKGQTRRKEEACNSFVLPAITSMCTYNVSRFKHWVVHKWELCPSLFSSPISFLLVVSLSSNEVWQVQG